MADVKRQQQDHVSATFNLFNSIVAIAVIVSLLGVVNTSGGAITGVVIALLIGLSWMRGFGELMPGLTFHFPGARAFAVAVAAILPARRAAWLKVIEALAYE